MSHNVHTCQEGQRSVEAQWSRWTWHITLEMKDNVPSNVKCNFCDEGAFHRSRCASAHSVFTLDLAAMWLLAVLTRSWPVVSDKDKRTERVILQRPNLRPLPLLGFPFTEICNNERLSRSWQCSTKCILRISACTCFAGQVKTKCSRLKHEHPGLRKFSVSHAQFHKHLAVPV